MKVINSLKKIIMKILKYLELTDNENTTFQICVIREKGFKRGIYIL